MQSISRRHFVEGAAAAAVAATATGITPAMASEAPVPTWDYEADVVVVGFGGAGAVAAATAVENGAEVIVLEKAPKEGGGTTRISTGCISTVEDPEKVLAYLHHQVKGLTDDSVWEEYVQQGTTVKQWLDDRGIPYGDLTGVLGADYRNWPGADGFGAVSLSPELEGETSGGPFWRWSVKFMDENNVQVLFDARAEHLVQNPETKAVIGVRATHSDGSEIAVKARRGVILCCGGFEYNDEMIGNYLVPSPLAHEGWIYNTGDGVRMGMEIGAEMWHMNMLDAYGIGFVAPGDNRARFGYNGSSMKTGSFMWVNRRGERFMCENPSNFGTPFGHRSVNRFALMNEPASGLPDDYDSSYANIPFYVVFDSKQFAAGPVYADPAPAGLLYVDEELGGQTPWSADNSEELAKGWILSGETLEDLVAAINENSADEGFRMDPAALQATVDAFNATCEAGEGDAFGRPVEIDGSTNMAPIADGPFYAVRMMPVMNTTKGGPKKDGQARVIGLDGEPIPHLYEAGTLGHSAAQVYCIFGANLAECLNFGRIAGRNAALEEPLA